MKLLVTAPPMLGAIARFQPMLEARGFEVTAPTIVQAMTEDDLVATIPQFDGWIAGDCPVSRRVMKAGLSGQLRAIVKWGVGVDNVDFEAAREVGLDVSNTPGVFGSGVAGVALGGLAEDEVGEDEVVLLVGVDDVVADGGRVDENVFAYSIGWGAGRSLVVYHNTFGSTSGWIGGTRPPTRRAGLTAGGGEANHALSRAPHDSSSPPVR